MAQVSKYPLKEEVYQKILESFFSTLAKIKTKKGIGEFLEDFLTPTERIVLAKRLAIYVMLAKGYDYETIRKVLHVSPPTIAAASNSYKYLQKGCHKVVKRLVKEEKMADFWLEVVEKISGTLAMSGKGSGSWRYLHQEVKRKRKKAF